MSKDVQYAIRRDGCWLMAYYDNGIEEFLWDTLVPIPTGVYSANLRDARAFESKATAELIAKRLNAEVVCFSKMKAKEDKLNVVS